MTHCRLSSAGAVPPVTAPHQLSPSRLSVVVGRKPNASRMVGAISMLLTGYVKVVPALIRGG